MKLKPAPELTQSQITRIIRAALPHRITAETVQRVAGGEWLAHHPVDSAILRELDKIREAKRPASNRAN